MGPCKKAASSPSFLRNRSMVGFEERKDQLLATCSRKHSSLPHLI